jgi:hypothetical protein
VVEDDQGALLGVEAPEPPLERIALGDGDRAIPGRRVVDRCELDVERVPAVPAGLGRGIAAPARLAKAS